MYNHQDPQSVEKYSSAVTLSDMEIFLFPELMYSLVLANIMSPRLWEWRQDPWFSSLAKLPPYRRILRVKQYIMDHFAFNLDLDTWGLTTKEKELARFNTFIDEATLRQSNALFGYEGDKYYFDIDIRRHFGLDKYTTDVIPYWKTETIEAMEAFRFKDGYRDGAGECVSLATLYAAALFVVAGIPLEDIFLYATPLHSQNFVDIKEGIVTNNRRIMTKNMWFNGSELSEKGRRALQNERVTMVMNNTGLIHVIREEASIDPQHYRRFTTRLHEYLKTDITYSVLASFLRSRSNLQRCFQIAHDCCGKPRYIEAEKVYAYEHNSKSQVGEDTQNLLLHEIDEDEFYTAPISNRIMLNEVESFFSKFKVAIDQSANILRLKEYLHHTCFNVDEVVTDLIAFCHIDPRLPSADKQWVTPRVIDLKGVESPGDVMLRLKALRGENEMADLAFTAFRDLAESSWKPFLKAAMERNPVSILAAAGHEIALMAEKLRALENESIYGSGSRLAQPDEVWNYRRGDGLEKAICLMNMIRAHFPEEKPVLRRDGGVVSISVAGAEYRFNSVKQIPLPEKDDFGG